MRRLLAISALLAVSTSPLLSAEGIKKVTLGDLFMYSDMDDKQLGTEVMTIIACHPATKSFTILVEYKDETDPMYFSHTFEVTVGDSFIGRNSTSMFNVVKFESFEHCFSAQFSGDFE